MQVEQGTRKAAPRQVDDEGRTVVHLHVNGAGHTVRARTTETLLDVLRIQLGLNGPREGCGVGMCGACTVLVDGRPISACLLTAVAAESREVTTVEGLQGADGELHPVQEAFIEHTAFQCAFCTPGFILTAKALLDEHPEATEEEAREYLAGNLCRCGSYSRILAAVMDAKQRLRRGGAPEVDQ